MEKTIVVVVVGCNYVLAKRSPSDVISPKTKTTPVRLSVCRRTFYPGEGVCRHTQTRTDKQNRTNKKRRPPTIRALLPSHPSIHPSIHPPLSHPSAPQYRSLPLFLYVSGTRIKSFVWWLKGGIIRYKMPKFSLEFPRPVVLPCQSCSFVVRRALSQNTLSLTRTHSSSPTHQLLFSLCCCPRSQLGQAHLILGLVQVLCRVIRRGEPAEEDKDGHGREQDDGDAAQDGAAVAKVGPLPPGLAHVALDGLVAELVVDHAAEGNAVAEELQGGDLSAPDHHRGDDQEDILEHAAEGEDEGGSLANLLGEAG